MPQVVPQPCSAAGADDPEQQQGGAQLVFDSSSWVVGWASTQGDSLVYNVQLTLAGPAGAVR